MTKTYVGVLVLEAVIITALWIFSQLFAWSAILMLSVPIPNPSSRIPTEMRPFDWVVVVGYLG